MKVSVQGCECGGWKRWGYFIDGADRMICCGCNSEIRWVQVKVDA